VAPIAHGGDIGAARKLFPGAPEPFLDLSTGINPNPYPIPALPPSAFTELPQPEALVALDKTAARAYGAPSPAHVAAVPGSQAAMSLIAGLLPPAHAAILGPTYAEHARAAALAGHEVIETGDLASLEGAALAVVVNPNNPDGRILGRSTLLALADRLSRRGGMLVVDEAFMDVDRDAESVASEVGRGGLIVLRSFGKLYGLPGLRLSFAVGEPETIARLAATLGPWPVSGAALEIGRKALADTAWKEAACASLEAAARRLDHLLEGAGLSVVGGTALFRLVEISTAAKLYRDLGRQGILVRSFQHTPNWLRFGLPGGEADWQRLAAALKQIC